MRIAQTIREVAAGHRVTDVKEVTDRVFHRIAQEDYAEVLYTLLRNQVLMELGRARNTEVAKVRGLSGDDFYNKPGGAAEATTDIDFDARPTLPRRDPKAAAIFEAFWKQKVPVEDGVIKEMGDLTSDDCRFIANRRFEQADLNYKMGQGYQKCAYEIDQAGVSTLREVDARVVHQALAYPAQETSQVA